MKHYPFGGSTAKRTANCQAWHKLSEGIPRVESAAATAGTNVHWLLEQKNLDQNFTISDWNGKRCPETRVAFDLDQIELAVRMWKADTEVSVKYRLTEWEAETTGEYSPEVGSTVDKVFTGTMPDGRKMVGLIDYKSGMGVQVAAEGNEQLLHNAWCLITSSTAQDLFEGVDLFVGIIIQPERSGDVAVREWIFTRGIVDDFAEAHERDIFRAKTGGAQPNAGDWCTFCPAAATCPAKTGAARRALLRDPKNIEELAENMAMVEDLKQWCNAVEKATYETLELGQDVPGWKLVAKRAMEKWVDESAALKSLRLRIGGKKNLVVEKIITPAEARKRLAAKGMEKSVADQMVSNLTKKESSGTTIAKADDKRQGMMSPDAFKAALASVQ